MSLGNILTEYVDILIGVPVLIAAMIVVQKIFEPSRSELGSKHSGSANSGTDAWSGVH